MTNPPPLPSMTRSAIDTLAEKESRSSVKDSDIGSSPTNDRVELMAPA